MSPVKRIAWMAGLSHAATHGYMSLLPAVLLAITEDQAMSFFAIGLIINVGYFLYGFGAFPAGHLADVHGSKKMLTLGVAGMAVSSLLVGILPGTAGFAVSYALLGLFASIYHPAGLSLIGRRVTENRGKVMGFHGVLGNLGMILAPLMAAGCMRFFGSWRSAYIIYGAAGLLLTAFLHMARIEGERDLAVSDLGPIAASLFRFREPAEAAPAVAPAAGGIPLTLLVLYLGSILSGFIFRGSLTYFPALLQSEVHAINGHEFPAVIAGYVTTAILSFGLVGAWIGGWINDRVRVPELVPIVIFLVVGPAMYFLGRLEDTPLIVAGCVFSLFYYSWQPNQNFLIAKHTSHASRGKGFGVSFFLLFGLGSIATAVGGYMVGQYGVDRFYWFMAALSVLAMLVALTIFPARHWNVGFPFRMMRKGGPLSASAVAPLAPGEPSR